MREREIERKRRDRRGEKDTHKLSQTKCGEGFEGVRERKNKEKRRI